MRRLLRNFIGLSGVLMLTGCGIPHFKSAMPGNIVCNDEFNGVWNLVVPEGEEMFESGLEFQQTFDCEHSRLRYFSDEDGNLEELIVNYYTVQQGERYFINIPISSVVEYATNGYDYVIFEFKFTSPDLMEVALWKNDMLVDLMDNNSLLGNYKTHNHGVDINIYAGKKKMSELGRRKDLFKWGLVFNKTSSGSELQPTAE